MRARAGAFAPIAAAFARRYRAVRDGLAPPDADRIRIGVVPRVVAGAVGLVAIVAVSTALAPSSSSQAVPRPSVGVAAQKASKSTAQRRVASSRVANPKPVRVRAVARREDRVTTAAPPRLVAQRVVKAAGVQGAQRPKGRAPVTTPPPPAPQPVAPAPQPPPAGETNDKPPGDDENSGPGGGNEDEENGGGKDEKDKDKDKDKDEGEDEDEAEDEDEDNGDEPQPQPPPPPDDKDDN